MPINAHSLVFQSGTAPVGGSTHPPLARPMRVPLLDNQGTCLWIDGRHPGCVASEGNPANGDTVNDLSVNGANGLWIVGPGSTVEYSGNGWSFANATAENGYLSIPAGPFADIRGDGTVEQRWMVVLYVRLQSLADFNTSGTQLPYYHSVGTGPTMSAISSRTVAGNRQIAFLRGNSLASFENYGFNMPDAAGAKFAQIAQWFEGDRLLSRMIYDDGVSGAAVYGPTITGLAKATHNFSDQIGRFGATSPFDAIGPGGIPASALNWKGYVLWKENNRRSGRKPLDVLNADWPYRLRAARRGEYA